MFEKDNPKNKIRSDLGSYIVFLNGDGGEGVDILFV
jgi:hypothetical protein